MYDIKELPDIKVLEPERYAPDSILGEIRFNTCNALLPINKN